MDTSTTRHGYNDALFLLHRILHQKVRNVENLHGKICAFVLVHPAPLHPVISVGPFAKWGIEFMHCKPTSSRGHGYIIVVMDYFKKWAEAMPTYEEDGKTSTLFLFNQIIARFGIP